MSKFFIKKSTYKNWDDVFSNSSEITNHTLKTGAIISKISGLINLKNPNARELKDGKAKIPVLNHLVNHPEHGPFLIDTGLDSIANKTSGGNFKGLLKSRYFKNRYFVGAEEGIDCQLERLGIKPMSVFLTHAHEHLLGLDSLPGDIEIFCGKGERDTYLWPFVYSDFFKRYNFKIFDFADAEKMPILGESVDVFQDGSFWAIATPGHTRGHTSYLINGNEKYLITGDACITEKGYMIEVETGKFSEDLEQARESFLKIMEFSRRYPQIKLIFGHESEKYRIEY